MDSLFVVERKNGVSKPKYMHVSWLRACRRVWSLEEECHQILPGSCRCDQNLPGPSSDHVRDIALPPSLYTAADQYMSEIQKESKTDLAGYRRGDRREGAEQELACNKDDQSFKPMVSDPHTALADKKARTMPMCVIADEDLMWECGRSLRRCKSINKRMPCSARLMTDPMAKPLSLKVLISSRSEPQLYLQRLFQLLITHFTHTCHCARCAKARRLLVTKEHVA